MCPRRGVRRTQSLKASDSSPTRRCRAELFYVTRRAAPKRPDGESTVEPITPRRTRRNRPGASKHDHDVTSPLPAKRRRPRPALVEAPIELGRSGVFAPPIGVGARSWGDRSGVFGLFGTEYTANDCSLAYLKAIDTGLNFIDTADSFIGSEELIGAFARVGGFEGLPQPRIGSKFTPPRSPLQRPTPDSVLEACCASLERLGVDQLCLYSLACPAFGPHLTATYIAGLAKCHTLGLTLAVGVSNFGAGQLRAAHSQLAAEGIKLATNQCQYSVLHRASETNGVAETCKDLGITLAASSPLALGLLTGKYGLGVGPHPPGSMRASFFTNDRVALALRVVDALSEVGAARNKSSGQVALNWLLCKGTQPIVGVKNAAQVSEAAGALGWRMSPREEALLDEASAAIHPSLFVSPIPLAARR